MCTLFWLEWWRWEKESERERKDREKEKQKAKIRWPIQLIEHYKLRTKCIFQISRSDNNLKDSMRDLFIVSWFSKIILKNDILLCLIYIPLAKKSRSLWTGRKSECSCHVQIVADVESIGSAVMKLQHFFNKFISALFDAACGGLNNFNANTWWCAHYIYSTCLLFNGIWITYIWIRTTRPTKLPSNSTELENLLPELNEMACNEENSSMNRAWMTTNE